jgi:NAD(P)H-nitrite reductase large subunit
MDKEFLSLIDHVGELLPSEKLDDEVLICECFCVNVGDIREACKSFQSFDLATMQENYSMGLGCQSCLRRIDSWVHKIF